MARRQQRWSYAIMGQVLALRICREFSSASIAPTNPALQPMAAPGWGWRSAKQSSRRTVAASRSLANPVRERLSPFVCRLTNTDPRKENGMAFRLLADENTSHRLVSACQRLVPALWIVHIV